MPNNISQIFWAQSSCWLHLMNRMAKSKWSSQNSCLAVTLILLQFLPVQKGVQRWIDKFDNNFGNLGRINCNKLQGLPRSSNIVEFFVFFVSAVLLDAFHSCLECSCHFQLLEQAIAMLLSAIVCFTFFHIANVSRYIDKYFGREREREGPGYDCCQRYVVVFLDVLIVKVSDFNIFFSLQSLRHPPCPFGADDWISSWRPCPHAMGIWWALLCS